MPAVTAELAAFALALPDLPDDARAAGVRSLVNIIGCALGGVHHPASEIAHVVQRETAGAPVATLIGRTDKTDLLNAAYLNCLASAAHAFDDTHLSTVIHPAGPVMGAVLALAERRGGCSGAALLTAFTLGIEVQCRLGLALWVPPAEPQLGWYATGAAAGIGAAAASARLLDLSEEQTRWALGLAANMASGFRQTHGSMCTSFVPAHAARSGVQAALLASHDFTASDAALEGANGYLDVFAPQANPQAAVADLGRVWHVTDNAFKPYPCGIVIHPVLDACLAVAATPQFDAGSVRTIHLTVNPLCLTLCDRPEPEGNQLAQVSVQHWAAAALARGRAGLPEGTDDAVRDPTIASLRAKVLASPDASIARDAALVRVELSDGRHIEHRIEDCIGSAARPMSDDQLSAKFLGQAEPILGTEGASLLLEHCWSIEQAASSQGLPLAARSS